MNFLYWDLSSLYTTVGFQGREAGKGVMVLEILLRAQMNLDDAGLFLPLWAGFIQMGLDARGVPSYTG